MYNVILLKMTDCHYCDKFFPIYKRAEELNKNEDIIFENYDMMEGGTEEMVRSKYPEIITQDIKGYPTVLIRTDDKLKEVNTVFDKDIEEGAKNFLDNITSMIQSSNEDYKEKYQKIYKKYLKCRDKYKKYKKKYINGKNKK